MMSRNEAFHEAREPFRDLAKLQLKQKHTSGPFSFLNPTRARFHHTDLSSTISSTSSKEGSEHESKEEGHQADTQLASSVAFAWRSRDNRKGRHALVVHPATDQSHARYQTPRSTASLSEVWKGIIRMMTQFPYWDISYHVAIYFTIGSVVWCINGFFVFLPLVQPSSEFDGEILYGGGITAFLGATIFEIGSIFLMFEAVNENRTGCFGWAVEKSLENNLIKLRPDQHACRHHHTNTKNFVGKANPEPSEGEVAQSASAPEHQRYWQWFPSMLELRTHYLREIGFLACLSQLFGASIFWISGFTALPGINNMLSQGLLDGIYWVPQIVGGSGFVVSGILFMLETQKKWYQPAFGVLGWHIGFWNLIGAIGFTLSGALGPAYSNSGALYQSVLATFWGSWAFLIASVLQWYESLDTHPVEQAARDD